MNSNLPYTPDVSLVKVLKLLQELSRKMTGPTLCHGRLQNGIGSPVPLPFHTSYICDIDAREAILD